MHIPTCRLEDLLEECYWSALNACIHELLTERFSIGIFEFWEVEQVIDVLTYRSIALCDSYLHPKVTKWKSSTHSHESGTQDISTLLLSPTLDTVNETASIINEKNLPTPLRTNELSLFSFYSHALHGHNHHNQLLYSSFLTSPSYTQIGCNGNVNNTINPVDRNSTFPSSSLNDNQYLKST